MTETCEDCGLLLLPEGSLWDESRHCERSWIFQGAVQTGNVRSRLACATKAIATLKAQLASAQAELAAWEAMARASACVDGRALFLFHKGQAFAQWNGLAAYGASYTAATFEIAKRLGLLPSPPEATEP